MYRVAFAFICLIGLVACKQEPLDFSKELVSVPLSPEDQLKTFQLEKGFEIQLVASEPMIQDPILITFDAFNRLWVVEMRGYMSNLEGSEEKSPVGRISILEDEDGDGLMDKRTIYLDSLVMPRAIGLFKNGALIAENNALWITHDHDGDLKADSKALLDSTYAANGVPEHSDNGFVRNVDNWYYSAKSRLRYRFQNGTWQRDSTEFRGQWGISQDDQGRLIYNYNWSQLHGDLVPPNYLFQNANHKPNSGIDHGLTIDRRIYPIRPNLAVNRGYIPGTLDSAGRLLEFTSACSPVVYRSTLFPEEYKGNVFVMENAGNLVKRNVVTQNGWLLEAQDPNPGKEFLASYDERFRPVHGSIGPDGALYIVDMYHGIVQHGSYMTPYLKEQTQKRQLDQHVHMGRIWRIVPRKAKQRELPKLGEMNGGELLGFLSHTDGWYRDMAQRLLVESGDQDLVPQVKELATNGSTALGRFHALWTLEGLDGIDESTIRTMLNDPDLLVLQTALRLAEPLAEKNPAWKSELAEKMKQLQAEASETVALQLALSARILGFDEKAKLLSGLFDRFGEKPLMQDAIVSSLEGGEFSFLSYLFSQETWKESLPHRDIFVEMLTTATIKNRKPQEIEGLLAMADKSPITWRELSMLQAMAVQAGDPNNLALVELPRKPSFFARTDIDLEPEKLEMVKSLYEWPGFKATQNMAAGQHLDDNGRKLFAQGRQKYLTGCAGCHGSNGKGVARMGPPLAASEWVLGDEKRLVMVILHGIEGPIEVAGKKYDAPEILPVMPAHSTMDDASIAAILTYIRNEWGNKAGAITGRIVSSTRHTSQGRVYPWSAAELNRHIESLNEAKPSTP
jgi:mono/diheme cytochrome c family protein/glucose/arabinose dehydrogenase